jgi:hypothetical protein
VTLSRSQSDGEKKRGGMRTQRVFLLAALAASFFCAVEAGASEGAIPQPSQELLEGLRDYCASATAPEPKRVADVDGFFNQCPRFRSICVEPLLDGYAFVEFEVLKTRSGTALPLGLYRAELADRGNNACAAFEAATIAEIPNSLASAFSRNKKCVVLTKIASVSARYGVQRVLRPVLDDAEASARLVYSDQVVTLPAKAIVAERREISISVPGGEATASCSRESSREELYRIVIPPKVFAPFQ